MTEMMKKTSISSTLRDLYQSKNYEMVSGLILQADAPDIHSLKNDIDLRLFSNEAIGHILKSLPLAEWKLLRGFSVNKKNRDTITPIMIKKYQDEFNASDLQNKIRIFKEVKDVYFNQNNPRSLKEASMIFMKKNWEHLIHLINSLETGLEIYSALFINDKNNLWSTVAAIQTIRVACKNKTIAETENLNRLFKNLFGNAFEDQIQVSLAEIILKKMEQ